MHISNIVIYVYMRYAMAEHTASPKITCTLPTISPFDGSIHFRVNAFGETTEHHYRCCFRKYFKNITSKCLDQHSCKWSIYTHIHIIHCYCVANRSNLLHITQNKLNKVCTSTVNHSFTDESGEFELDAIWFDVLNQRTYNLELLCPKCVDGDNR